MSTQRYYRPEHPLAGLFTKKALLIVTLSATLSAVSMFARASLLPHLRELSDVRRVYAEYSAAKKQCDALEVERKKVCFAGAEINKYVALAELHHPSHPLKFAPLAGYPTAVGYRNADFEGMIVARTN